MRNTLIKTGAAIIAALAMASCGTQKQYIHVSSISGNDGIEANPLVYSLPKTTVTVKVTAINEVSVRGPYWQYAQKYLGTDDIINANSSKWSLGNVEISSYPIKDTARTYMLKTSYACGLSFSPEGFLESVNTKPDFAEQSYRASGYYGDNQQADDIASRRQFQEINVNRYETVFDTVLHVVDADSIFTTVPTAKKNVVRKSLDEQAQELANQIFVLRDDRNALLVGESDGKSLPSGESLKFMIEQLNKLEESYMSMFVGKKIKTEKTYMFEYVPTGAADEQDVIFRFSKEYGVQSKSSQKGAPINITIHNLGENSSETSMAKRQAAARTTDKNASQLGLAYLGNAPAMVRVVQGSGSMAEKVINICQMSQVRYLPDQLSNSKDFKLILYPATGTIKSIN